MATDIGLWVAACLLVIAGFAGLVFPVLPGTPFVFAGLALAAWANDFQRVGWVTLTILGLLTLLSFAVDLLASVLGAKRVGASKLALIGAFLGTIVGVFSGILGLLFGPFLGAVAGELLALRGLAQAAKVGVATWLGLIFGTLAKIALAFTMLGVFATAYFV